MLSQVLYSPWETTRLWEMSAVHTLSILLFKIINNSLTIPAKHPWPTLETLSTSAATFRGSATMHALWVVQQSWPTCLLCAEQQVTFSRKKKRSLKWMWPHGFCSQSTLGFKLETFNGELVLWERQYSEVQGHQNLVHSPVSSPALFLVNKIYWNLAMSICVRNVGIWFSATNGRSEYLQYRSSGPLRRYVMTSGGVDIRLDLLWL